jgi:hypothetical protein
MQIYVEFILCAHQRPGLRLPAAALWLTCGCPVAQNPPCCSIYNCIQNFIPHTRSTNAPCEYECCGGSVQRSQLWNLVKAAAEDAAVSPAPQLSGDHPVRLLDGHVKLERVQQDALRLEQGVAPGAPLHARLLEGRSVRPVQHAVRGVDQVLHASVLLLHLGGQEQRRSSHNLHPAAHRSGEGGKQHNCCLHETNTLRGQGAATHIAVVL